MSGYYYEQRGTSDTVGVVFNPLPGKNTFL